MLKNTLFLTATLGLALFAPACGGDKDEDGSGDTGGTTIPGDDDDDTTIPTGDMTADVGCNGTNVEMSIEAYVQDGSRGIIDASDTSNSPPYYEAHTLLPTGTSTNFTSFGATVASTGTYADGTSTVFSCDPDVHWEEATKGSIMSYVVRAYDLNGLADCFAVGNDPDGMLAGTYDTYGTGIDSVDISAANCAIGSWSR